MSKILSTRNLIESADCYKFSHPFMINRDVTGLTSYIEARHSESTEIVFFGLQIYIRDYLSTPVTMADVDRAARYARSAGIPFHRDMWEHVVINYGGFLPVRIQALPEGTPVSPGVPMVQITSTDTKFPGLISVIETSLLRAIWYPTTVATLSRDTKRMMDVWLMITSDQNPAMVLPTMLNDFGARGASSGESAIIGGLAHLVNFIGSDTFEAIGGAEMFYDHNVDRDGPVLVSVPATEHSVTTMHGEDGESAFVGKVIDTFTGQGFPIISIVADSFDMDRFIEEYIGTDYYEKIMERNGFIVVRPDSGVPHEIVPRVLEMLWEKFGGTINAKGFKVLNPHIRVIQGDGIYYEEINQILWVMAEAGFSAENVVFGMGGSLLQKVSRDDHSFAMKTNAMKEMAPVGLLGGNMETGWQDVQKKPKTDMSKASKGGRQAVVFYDDAYHAMREDQLLKTVNSGHGTKNWLEDVWDTGKTIRTQNFQSVRDNAKI